MSVAYKNNPSEALRNARKNIVLVMSRNGFWAHLEATHSCRYRYDDRRNCYLAYVER